MNEIDIGPRIVSDKVMRNRRIADRILSLPQLLPTEVLDEHDTRTRMSEAAADGRGHLVIFDHFGKDDGLRVDKALFKIPVVGERVVNNPISDHQHNEILAKIANDILGGPIVPVINNDSMERPEYQFIDPVKRAEALAHFIQVSADALKHGEAVTLAVNAGRRPFLDMDDDQNAVANFMAAMKRSGVEDYGVVNIALSIPGARNYEKRNYGGWNLGKRYVATLGEYHTASEILAANSLKTIDSSVRQEFLGMIPEEYKQPETFDSVAIVGAAGQTGEMFFNQIRKKARSIPVTGIVKPEHIVTLPPRTPDTVKVAKSIHEGLVGRPGAVILATANTSTESLEELASNLHDGQTLILPQNGVGIVGEMRKVLGDKDVKLIRASLFTPVSRGEVGAVSYNPSKLRIGLASVMDTENEVFSVGAYDAMEHARALFLRSGFDVELFEDYRSMEWTKLVVNGLGSSGAITGLAPQATFEDRDLFALEARALKDRLRLLDAEGIDFAKVPWANIGLITKLRHAPTPLLQLGRNKLGNLITRGRSNEAPAAARKIAAHQPTELNDYHQPFIDLAYKNGLPTPPADAAILAIFSAHESGDIDLTTLSPQDKKDILLGSYNALRS